MKQWLDKTFYASFEDGWDDKLFREAILAVLKSTDRVLDVGAGVGVVKAMNFKGSAQYVTGVDLDPRVTDNPFLDLGIHTDGATLPFEDGAFDLVFADNVLEHLAQPAAVFAEIARVLKPGGSFFFKTPNRFNYVPLIARYTPQWFHELVNKRRGLAAEDSFETLYRANSRGDIQVLAAKTGFNVTSLHVIEGRPEYLRSFSFLYIFGILFERIVNASPIFTSLRVLLVGQMTKK